MRHDAVKDVVDVRFCGWLYVNFDGSRKVFQ